MDYLKEASRILFGDPDFASQDYIKSQMDDLFSHPVDGRKISINSLIAELRESAA